MLVDTYLTEAERLAIWRRVEDHLEKMAERRLTKAKFKGGCLLPVGLAVGGVTALAAPKVGVPITAAISSGTAILEGLAEAKRRRREAEDAAKKGGGGA
jgi:hypothetical protein